MSDILNIDLELCCNCDKNDALEDHECPFKVEIHDDEDTLCNCCEECMYECAMDV